MQEGAVTVTDELMQLKEWVEGSNNVVFFGGAGVSTESNIPDFRSADGLYSQEYKYPPEQIVSHSFFMNQTEEFYRFYKDRMLLTKDKKTPQPNNAHKALAKLEERGILKAVITQNIDGLHQKAGSKVVMELHGSVHRNFCTKCHKAFPGTDYIMNSDGIPKCDKCGGIIKPDVVLYEEGLDSTVIYKSINYIANADILIIGGTSLVVYPAAGFVNEFKGSKLILMNRAATSQDRAADLIIRQNIGEALSIFL